jgi:hypothetical protein
LTPRIAGESRGGCRWEFIDAARRSAHVLPCSRPNEVKHAQSGNGAPDRCHAGKLCRVEIGLADHSCHLDPYDSQGSGCEHSPIRGAWRP